jgi:hypothetical protein
VPKSLPARPAEPEGLHATAQTQQSATGPTPQRCWIWEPVGVFALRRGLFPSTAAIATRFPGLLSASKAVLAVWRRPRGKDGEGFATRRAKAASCPDPVVLFVVGLLAPLAVADDGMVPAARAASWQQGQRKRMHLECGLVSRLRQCDKENQGWREGPPLTVSCQVPIRGGPSPSPAYPFQTKEEYCLLRLTANPPALNFGRYKAVSRQLCESAQPINAARPGRIYRPEIGFRTAKAGQRYESATTCPRGSGDSEGIVHFQGNGV